MVKKKIKKGEPGASPPNFRGQSDQKRENKKDERLPKGGDKKQKFGPKEREEIPTAARRKGSK